MPSANRAKQAEGSEVEKNCKVKAPVVDVLQYRVVKEHHHHRWLRQERLLEITLTHIHNCKPPKRKGESPKITKRFLLTSITMIGIRGKKAFSIHVRNDHVYYYCTPRAINIAFKIQRYVAAANAVDALLRHGDRRRTLLMKQLVTWTIPLPGTQQPHGENAYTYQRVHLTKLRCAINGALLNGAVSGSDELQQLSCVWRMKRDGSEKDLFELRRAMNSVRDLCTSDVVKQSELSSSGVSHSEIVMCVEDIIQRILIRPNFEKIVSFLREDEELSKREELFSKHRELLRGRSADVFAVPNELRSLDYNLALRHFDLMTSIKSPNDLLDQIVNIAACICLTVYVAVNLPPPSDSRRRRCPTKRESCSGSAMQDIGSPPSEKESSKLFKGQKHPVLPLSTEQLRPAHVESPNKRGCYSLPISLSVERGLSEPLELSQSVSVEDNSNKHALLNSSEPSVGTSIELSSEEDVSIVQFCNASALSSHIKKGGLCADTMFPIFVHLLCETQIPDVCLLLRFADILSDPSDTSERAYYFATLGAAVAVVCEVDETESAAAPE